MVKNVRREKEAQHESIYSILRIYNVYLSDHSWMRICSAT